MKNKGDNKKEKVIPSGDVVYLKRIQKFGRTIVLFFALYFGGGAIAQPCVSLPHCIVPPTNSFVPFPNSFATLTNCIVPPTNSFVLFPNSFVILTNCIVPLRNSFVLFPNSFVTQTNCIVLLPNSFVLFPNSFVTLTNCIVPLTNLFVPFPNSIATLTHRIVSLTNSFVLFPNSFATPIDCLGMVSKSAFKMNINAITQLKSTAINEYKVICGIPSQRYKLPLPQV